MIFLSILTQKETNVIFLGVLKEIHNDGKAIKKIMFARPGNAFLT